MAKKTIKLSQLSKDFAMKSKDVLDAFKEMGMEKKSGANADDVEFALFFQKVTKANQIENLDEYVKGTATIRAEKPAEEPKAEEAPKAEAKPAAPKAEAKPEVKPEAPKAEAKPAAKAEVKLAAKAEAKPEAPKSEVKAAAPKAEAKPAQPKAEEKPAPVQQKKEEKPAEPQQPRIGRIDRPLMTAEELRIGGRILAVEWVGVSGC